MSEPRFFYAKECYRTWPKLFVLSEDGKLYCEYLDHYIPTIFCEDHNYLTFSPDEFKWNGYQTIVEITKEEAIAVNLTNQSNWIVKYLTSLET